MDSDWDRWEKMNCDDMPWLVLQVADSAFPIGGFAHSNGLESAMKWGELAGEQRLQRFFRDSLMQVARSCLPMVRATHRGDDFSKVDWLCDRFLNNHVSNRASRRQGQALINTACCVFPFSDLSGRRRMIRQEGLPCHLAPAFGWVLATLTVDEKETLRLFLFMTLRSLISSAVRLSLVGPLRGQAIQYELNSYLQTVLERCREIPLAEVVQTAPVIDILQATHDRLYSRLFQS